MCRGLALRPSRTIAQMFVSGILEIGALGLAPESGYGELGLAASDFEIGMTREQRRVAENLRERSLWQSKVDQYVVHFADHDANEHLAKQINHVSSAHFGIPWPILIQRRTRLLD